MPSPGNYQPAAQLLRKGYCVQKGKCANHSAERRVHALKLVWPGMIGVHKFSV